MSRSQKRTSPDMLTPPDLGVLRGIRNQGGTCAINTVLQVCFQIPHITSILESSKHPQLVDLRSLHDRYKRGTGPLTIGNLSSITPPGLNPKTADAGEILAGFCTLLRQEGIIHHLAPEPSLAMSARTAASDRAFLQSTSEVHDSHTLVFQFGRSDPMGTKIKRHTTYPVTLDSETYHLTCGRSLAHPLALRAVIVHQGHKVDKGHYVIFIKLTNSSGWALCDDDKIQWVSEMEALAQEAFILVYTQPVNPEGRKIGPTEVRTMQPMSTATTHEPDASAGSCLDLEGLFAKMNMRDTPVGETKRGLPRPVLVQQLSPAGRVSASRSLHQQSCRKSSNHPDEDLHIARSNSLEQFRMALNQKLTRSGSTWITISSITQWITGATRIRPCRLLSVIDTKLLLTELGHQHDLTSLVKSYPFIEWKEVSQVTWVRIRPPQADPILETTMTRRIITSPPVESHRPKVMVRLQDNPTDRSTGESVEARLDLVDWCVKNRQGQTPSPVDDRNRMQWLEKRLHWNIVRILRDPSATVSLTDQLYQQGRQWFLGQQVGQFLDKIRNIARVPEIARLTRSPMVTICVSNIYARTQLDIQARLHSIGITVIQEVPAHFEVRYSGKLRIQSASLTVKVYSDQKLLDFLQGKISLEGILGPVTVTILDDDSDIVHQMELKPNKQIDRRGLPLLTNIWSTLGASETQILSWILLCTSSQLGRIWTAESVTLANPDGPAHLPTIWGTKDQHWHRGHILLQSETPAVSNHTRDSMAAVSSISGIDKLYSTDGLEDTLTPPRKPENSPRQVIRIGLPTTEATTSWISSNQFLQRHSELAKEAVVILSSAPSWLQQCAIHAKLDPVLGRCSWEEKSSSCIRFRQTQKTVPFIIDRARMRVVTWEMLNQLQQLCWPDNEPFKIEEINFIGYHAHSKSELKRLEGMITIEYRQHIQLEQDLLVGLLLAMYIGNDIPEGETGSGLKWCPLRNEMACTACTVTRVTARRTTRGQCRQDIPLGVYDRQQQRWTLRDKTDEISYLLHLARKSDDLSLTILDRIRSAPWKSRSPNLRLIREKCVVRVDQ